jgi:hypothetical protein
LVFIKCECYEHVVQKELSNPKIHTVMLTTQEWNDIFKKNLQKLIHDKELKMSGMNWTPISKKNQITTKEPNTILH